MDKRAQIIIASLSGVIIAGVFFFAGMEYQSYRITSGIEEAFGDMDDDSEASEEAVEEALAEPVPFGESAAWQPDPDLPDDTWDVELDDLECGVGEVEGAAENPAYLEDMTGTEPEYVAAKPGKGDEFCVVTSTWTNAGSSASSLSTYNAMSGVIIDGKQFSSSGDDESYSDAITDDFDETINPGRSAELIQIFTVPEGSKATAAFLVSDVMMSEAGTLVFAAS